MEIGITQYMGEDTTLGNIQTKAFLCRVALVLQCVSYLTLWTSGQLLQRRRNAWRSNHICNNNLPFWHASFLWYSIFPQSRTIQAWPNKDFLTFQNIWRVSWIFCSDFPRLAILLSGWRSHFFLIFWKDNFCDLKKEWRFPHPFDPNPSSFSFG